MEFSAVIVRLWGACSDCSNAENWMRCSEYWSSRYCCEIFQMMHCPSRMSVLFCFGHLISSEPPACQLDCLHHSHHSTWWQFLYLSPFLYHPHCCRYQRYFANIFPRCSPKACPDRLSSYLVGYRRHHWFGRSSSLVTHPRRNWSYWV